MATLVTSKAADANFKWEVASSNSSTTPLYLVLKRKNASAGRILYVVWTSTPAANNAAILDATPTLNALFCAFFPSGNVDTPSNLAAASGTIMGVDTAAVEVSAAASVSTIYAASTQPFYFDSTEAVAFFFQNPGSSAIYLTAAGYILVDAADAEYAGVLSTGQTILATHAGIPAWVSTTLLAGSSAAPTIRTNYGAANRTYFCAYAASGLWANQGVGAADVLTDTAATKAYFAPVQLLGQTKGEGFALKLRQMAQGPGVTVAFSAYSTTGPVIAARAANCQTAGGNGILWMTNFKI